MPRLEREFVATEPQSVFWRSTAKVVGYGGAMGGGKSRALCERAFALALEHPGLKTLICRQAHTSITETTKKTMAEQVIPPALREHCRKKESGGEDWIELPNGSRFHFIGLDDPVRWFSSEIGLLLFDEAHEIAEEDVILLMSRLRQPGMPHRTLVAFNPSNPGHWLQRWFISGASRTRHGFRKDRLFTKDADSPIGDCEFVFAKATDNPHLPVGYIESTLAGMPRLMRKRMLEGEWIFTSGHCFFDVEALDEYRARITTEREAEGFREWVGVTTGADDRLRARLLASGTDPGEGKLRFKAARDGKWVIWRTPIRERLEVLEDQRKLLHPAHRYIVTADVSSGGSTDFSAIQVLDVEGFEQVAEFQDMVDPDLLAVECYRIGLIYNVAFVAPEVTGGYGLSLANELRRLGYPRIYTRRVLDRRTQQLTDRYGWDTTSKTRPLMLDALERVLRERELELHGERTLGELVTFVRTEKKNLPGVHGKPEAQPGTNDDLVVSLAIGVTVREQMPRELRKPPQREYAAMCAAAGY